MQTEVQEYELEMPPELLQRFKDDTSTPEQPAVFRAGGVSYPVMIRLRGASARYLEKKSWNVSFSDTKFEGRGSLNLVAEFQDATMLAEKLAFDLLAAMRVPASRAKYVRLKINGQYEGVYLDIEQVSKAFLKAHAFADTDATIYRCGWRDCEFKLPEDKAAYQGQWVKKTNVTGSINEVIPELDRVLHTINRAPEPGFPDALAQQLELESYLRVLVNDVLVSNDYIEDSESYFVYDARTKRWSYVPWDLNNADSRWWYTVGIEQDGEDPYYKHPLFNHTPLDPVVQSRYLERAKYDYPGYGPNFSNLATRVVMNPTLRARLIALLDKALAEVFTPEVMNARIAAIHQLLDPHMKADPYMAEDFLIDLNAGSGEAPNRVLHHGYRKFVAGQDQLQRYVAKRRTFIQQELARYRGYPLGLTLEAVDPAAGWVELMNRGSAPASLAGMKVTSRLRDPFGANLPERTLAPGEKLRLGAAELGITLAPGGGELGLFTGTSAAGMKDCLFYGPLPAGQRYVRSDADPTLWELQ
ncbi:Inner spore coat protein H [Aggregicoccus sp. 17bor-14]|nr:CotH kinase family protein [Simulacricoccus sp. 17bor-14]MRI90603.1 Inner spore coat protein H [Aggregicoccus sp. 17bor-14]